MEKSFYIGEEENLKPKPYGKKTEYISGDNVELIPDPDTENPYRELFGKDKEDLDYSRGLNHVPVIETTTERNERNEAYIDEVIDSVIDQKDVDYVGDPDDADKLEAEHTELMKKYENYGLAPTSEKMANSANVNEVLETHKPKHESMAGWQKEAKMSNYELTTRQKESGSGHGGYAGKDNLKTLPDNKKQRTFRERIRKFLDFN